MHRLQNLVAWDGVWAAVGARLLKVGLSVLTPPLERGGNAVLGTGWYRTVCGFERRRYKAGTPFIIDRRHSDVNPYDGGEKADASMS